MASTYVNALRLNEMGTGDESGNWGVVTNLNLDMIGEAFGYGTENMGSDANTTITMADGAVDEARNLYLKITSTSLSATRTVTLAPNTVGKVWIIENATTGGQVITIKQGSGATIDIPNGDVKMIATDGAGSGAAVYDLLVDLNIATKLTIKNPATSSSPATVLLQSGDTDVAAADVLGKVQFQAPDEATGTDAILVAAEIAAVSEGDFSSSNNATKLSFKTAASEAAAEKMSLSSGGNLTLPTDGVVIAAGVNSDVTLTHVHDTGLLLNGTMQLQFNDASQYINAPSATVLDINATDEIELNATLADVNANLDVSGTYQGGGTMTTGGNIVIPDDGNIGTASDTDAVHIGSEGQVGIGTAAGDTIQFRVYNNETGHYVGYFRQDNASSTTSALYSAHDGAGSAIQGLSAGHTGYFSTSSASHGAVYGVASNSSHYGLIGYSTHGCYATSVYCVGALYKGSGTFRIPHGLRAGHDLLHSFIEGPQCDLIYRGTVDLVDGRATVSMDTKYGMTAGTFAWLTKDVQTFTSNETGWDAVKSSFSGDTITIECQNTSSTDTISWMVVAERDDPNIKASEITDSNGDLIIERPSEPAPPAPE